MPARRPGSASGLTGLILSAKASGVTARTLCAALAIVAAALSLAGPSSAVPGDEPFKLDDTQLEPVAWSDLDGWAADDHLAAFAAFQTSCRPFRSVPQQRDEQRMFNALREICRRSAALRPANAEAARAFF